MTSRSFFNTLFLIAVIAIVQVPLPVQASVSSKNTCSVSASVSVDSDALSSRSARPTLTGTATDTKTVQIILKREDSTKVIYKSKVLKVKEGAWKIRVSKKLSKGNYDVEVFCPKTSKGTLLAEESLVIGSKTSTKNTNTTFAVSSVPLLFGGTARAGTSVPVAYLQITNTGKESATLKGFSVQQNGSASTASVIGFTTVDDKGGSRGYVGGEEGKTPFKNAKAFVPTEDTVFAPKQMRLFTIKAALSQNISSFIGKNLKIDVVGVDAEAKMSTVFPIRGTTWVLAL